MTCERSRWAGPLATLLGLTLAATACEPQQVSALEQPSEGSYGVRLRDDLLDFGSQEVGSLAERMLTVVNDGDGEAVIVSLDAPSEQLRIGPVSPVLPPGETRVPILWQVTDPVLVEGRLALQVDRGDGQLEVLRVPVYGSGIGPDLTLSIAEHDFGALDLGCAEQLDVTLSNSGTAAFDIQHVRLDGGDEFSLTRASETPLTVPAFGSASFTVQYRPTDDQPDAAHLRIQTDEGEAVTRLHGSGVASEHEVIELTARKGRPVVMLVFVNEVVSSGWYLDIDEIYQDSLPTLFEELKATKNDYRVAFVGLADGMVRGSSPPYIDASMSTSSAVAEAITQSDASRTAGDNDRMLDTLMAGLSANESWMDDPDWIGTGGFRIQPKVVLVAINDDADQSSSSPSVAVSAFEGAVETPDDIVLHGISGPLGGYTCAVGNPTFKNAVDLTGGTYHDICALDWRPFWRSIVRNSVPPGIGSDDVRVPIRGTPLVPSLRLTLEGQKLTTGWRWDPDEHAIIIESEFSLAGEKLRIEYQTSTACGG